MKTSSHFSSKHSAFVLGTMLTASTLFAGVTFAQSTLTIPTNLNNAAIAIQRIFLSPTGTSTDPSANIVLDGTNGSITTNGNITGRGTNANLTVGGIVRLENSTYRCPAGSPTDCVLKVDTTGRVSMTNTLSGGTDNDEGIFRRTPGTSSNQKNNIYLALEDGTATVAGRPNTSTQSFLRVGAGAATDSTEPTKDDTALVVAGVIESRGGLFIKKRNNDAELSNSVSNRIADIGTRNFTSLDLTTTVGKVNFRSQNRNGDGQNLPTSFLFSADGVGVNTRVGINIPAGQDPSAELHVGQGGVFMVGRRPGGEGSSCNGNGSASSLNSSGECIPVNINTLIADSTTNRVGIGINSNAGPQKTLDVNGDAAIANVLTVGHDSTFNPGGDKLAVNGNTRANAYYYNSDRRYKSNIVLLQSPLANLLKISGYHYYSSLENKDTLGVIAQEVEAVYPELVQTDSSGYKSVQYGNLVAPIIEAIRELSIKIDNLFTLYVSQQAKIDRLEVRLLKLESQVK